MNSIQERLWDWAEDDESGERLGALKELIVAGAMNSGDSEAVTTRICSDFLHAAADNNRWCAEGRTRFWNLVLRNAPGQESIMLSVTLNVPLGGLPPGMISSLSLRDQNDGGWSAVVAKLVEENWPQLDRRLNGSVTVSSYRLEPGPPLDGPQ